MSTDQLIAEFKALSVEQRQQVAEAIIEDDSWIPESFRHGMDDFKKQKTVSMEAALTQKPPHEA